MDFICIWARKNYREAVIKCLAAGSGLQQRFTSPISSRFSEAGVSSRLGTPSLSFKQSVEPSAGNNQASEAEAGQFSRHVATSQMPPDAGSEEDVYGWSRWSSPPSRDDPAWTRTATIRHSNLVEFVYQELTVPDEEDLLWSCLEFCFPGSDTRDAARRLLCALIVNGVFSAIRRGDDLMKEGDRTQKGRSFIFFRTQLRPRDWQIERYQLRINCSFEAIWMLIEYVRKENLSHTSAPFVYDGENCTCWLNELDQFKTLDGKQGANLAMQPLSQRQMCFQRSHESHGKKHFKGAIFQPGERGGLSQKDLETIRKAIASDDRLQSRVVKYNTLLRVPFPADVDSDDAASQGILIQKRPTWPTETPRFCFLATGRDISFNDEARLGVLIQTSLERNEVFGADDNRLLDEEDSSFIRRWAGVLRGEMPATSLMDVEAV